MLTVARGTVVRGEREKRISADENAGIATIGFAVGVLKEKRRKKRAGLFAFGVKYARNDSLKGGNDRW